MYEHNVHLKIKKISKTIKITETREQSAVIESNIFFFPFVTLIRFALKTFSSY